MSYLAQFRLLFYLKTWEDYTLEISNDESTKLEALITKALSTPKWTGMAKVIAFVQTSQKMN